MHTTDIILLILTTYAALGVLFAVPFVLSGVKQLDPVAAATHVAVRLVWLPGAVAVWPLLLSRGIQNWKPRR